MIDKAKPTALTERIERNTQLGSKELQACHVKQALDHFMVAYKAAETINDAAMIRICAFNLGAVYIANGNPEKGIEYLKKAIPPADINDGHSNGDLYYNFGLGYESLGNKEEAVKYFELALEDYQKMKDRTMEAEVAMKTGAMYFNLNRMLQSARAYGVASASYAELNDCLLQAQCLAQQARALLKANKVEETLHIADDCMLICQKITQNEALGKVYNDLGLLYTQSKDFNQALTCFELALPLSRGPKGEKRQQAVILQNLGAVYNSVGDYQRSLSFHESAANLCAELNNRGAQGQCFINLAFAYSRIGDTESAGECYLHALQAAKDTNDKHGQWQAMEGLGSVYFHAGNIDRAIKYFQTALSTLAGSGEKNTEAQERLVQKLRDAIEHINDESPLSSVRNSPLPVNGINPSPSRKETLDYQRVTPKPPPFRRDEVDYRGRPGTSSGRKHRHHSAGNSSTSQNGRQSRGSQNGRDSHASVIPEKQLENGKGAPVRRLSRRKSSQIQMMTEGGGRRQAYLAPLLRPASYDSEEEWKKKKKHKKGYFIKDERYRARVGPLSPEESEQEIEDTVSKRDKSAKKNQAKRENENNSEEIMKQKQLRSKLASIHVEPQQGYRNSDSDETDQETRASTPGGHRMRPPSRAKQNNHIKEEDLGYDPAPDSSETEVSDANSARSDLNNTEVKNYAEHMRKLEQDSDDQETDSGSDTAVETETEFEKTLGPPNYTAPMRPDDHQSLQNTYIKPQGEPSTSKQSTMKKTVPDPNNPDYQTIRSVLGTMEQDVHDEPPELPPRPFNKMSFGEQEVFLKNYRQHQMENSRDNIGRPTEGDDVKLPMRNKGKATSKACIIM